jgi:hypothetical protein
MTVLTLALILGSISVASAASGKVKLSDIADNANEEAIQVTYDLGIVTGTPEGAYEPDKAVNRAEFAALITRALAIPESALASYTSSTFKDTSGYSWAVPYLAILQQRGIMKGDGYGNAMPSRTITPNEAVTMVLRAVGYTDNASVLVGQWPANYVALGQSQNLYESVSNDVQMNKASAAQMIYNVLTTQLVQVDANSTVKYLYDADSQFEQSLLTTSLNCYIDYENVDSRNRKVVTYTDAAKSKINLTPKVGAYGTLYKSKADDEVVALTNVSTEFLTGRFMFNLNNGNASTFQTVDGTSYSLGINAQEWINAFNGKNTGTAFVDVPTSRSAIFVNGAQFPGLSNDECDNYIVYSVGGYYDNQSAKLIIAAGVSGKTITEVRSVAVWDAEATWSSDVSGAHFLYEAGQIVGTKFNGHDFPLDVNGEIDPYAYVLNGIDSLDDLSANNVVYIYKNRDRKIARIDVGTATQAGTVTNVNLANYSRTVGGTVLYTAPWKNDSRDDIDTAGNEGTAILDVYHRIYAFELGEASKGNFAVVTGTNSLTGTGSFGDLQFRIFDKTGTDVVYSIKEPFEYTDAGTTYKIYRTTLPTTPAATDRLWNTVSGDFAPGALIEYTLSGGKISKVARTGISIAVGDGSVNPSGSILSIAGTPNKLIDSSVLVYVKDGDNYSLGSIKDLLDKELKQPAWYIQDANGKVRALLVDTKDTGANSVFVLVSTISMGSNTGGTYNVVGGLDFADGASAAVKSWDYFNDALPVTDPELLQAVYVYPSMLKFTLSENGVLKSDGEKYLVADPDAAAIMNVGFGKRTSGTGGTFQIAYTTTVAAIDANGDRYYPVTDTVAFEANAVLYKVDGRQWKAYAPSEANFKADTNSAGVLNGVYVFMKTDPKKAYDVIIKVSTYTP